MTAGRRDFPLWSTLLLQFRPHFSFGKSEDKSAQPERKNLESKIQYENHDVTASATDVFKIMKRYTLRAAIHDAKIFNQLRLEYRGTNKNRRKDSSNVFDSKCNCLWKRTAKPSNHEN
jgi:hypothetical protein